MSRSFTLVEVLITSLILAIIAGIGMMGLFGYQKSAQIYDTTQKIAIYIEFAKTKSITQENGYQWGIHLEHPENGQSFWQLFYGNSFSSDHSLDKIYLPKGLEFILPAKGQSEDFIFQKSSGYLSSNSATSTTLYSLADSSQVKTITVNKYGVINY